MTPTPGPGPGSWPLPDRSHVPDAEAALLGCALYCPRTARETLADLGPEDFSDRRHRAVLAAVRTVLGHGQDPEMPLVLAAYARGAETGIPLAAFGVLLAECAGRATSPALAPEYRRVLLETRFRRDAVRAAGRIAHAAEHAPAADLHHVLNESLADLARTLTRMTEPARGDTHDTVPVPGLPRKEAA